MYKQSIHSWSNNFKDVVIYFFTYEEKKGKPVAHIMFHFRVAGSQLSKGDTEQGILRIEIVTDHGVAKNLPDRVQVSEPARLRMRRL